MADLGSLILKAMLLGVVSAAVAWVGATASNFIIQVVIPITIVTLLVLSQGLVNALKIIFILLVSTLMGAALFIVTMLSAVLTLAVLSKIHTWIVDR